MKYKSRAIALTYIKQGESSIISKLFTENKGLQTFIVKGVRSKKSKNKIVFFEPLKLLNINARYNPKNSLQYLEEIVFEKSPISLKNKMFNTFIAIFIAEVSSKVLQENEENQDLFIFLWEVANSLHSGKQTHRNYVLNFMLDLSKYLGFYPSSIGIKNSFFDLESGEFLDQPTRLNICLDKKNTSYLKALLKDKKVNISQEQKSALLKNLFHYYKLHHYNLDNITSHLIIESLRG